MAKSSQPAKKQGAESSSRAEDQDPTEALETSSAQGTEGEPATGYIYLSPGADIEEIDEAAAAESLTHQLLRNGETVDRKKSRGTSSDFVPGTAVGATKGSQASDDEHLPSGAPVLPQASRISSVASGKSPVSGFALKVAGATCVAALAVAGIAYAIYNTHPGDSNTTEVPVATSSAPAETASASPSKSTNPTPTINDRVPEVKYVDPTDEAVVPGTIEYVEEPTQEPMAEETTVEEAPAETAAPEVTSQAAVEAPTAEATESAAVEGTVTPAPIAEPTTEAPVVEPTVAPAPMTSAAQETVQTPEAQVPGAGTSRAATQ